MKTSFQSKNLVLEAGEEEKLVPYPKEIQQSKEKSKGNVARLIAYAFSKIKASLLSSPGVKITEDPCLPHLE